MVGDELPYAYFATPEGDGPFPVVILTHGFQLGPEDYRSTGEHLASWGLVVVLPQLPGGLISAPTHIDQKEHLAAVLNWVDAEAGNPAGSLLGLASANSLGLAGHSMGGKISLLLAAEDSRPDAVFGIDPVDSGPPFTLDPAGYPSVAPELMPSLGIPLVLLGETVNATASFGQTPCAPAADNFQQYYQHAVGPALEIEVLDANHMSFLDNTSILPALACPAGSDDPAVTRSLTQGYLVAFFRERLYGDSSMSAFLTGTEIAADAGAGLINYQSKNGF